MPQVLGYFGDKFLGIECTLEAETSVSNLTQYKLFIGDDQKNTLFGVTFSFNCLEQILERIFGPRMSAVIVKTLYPFKYPGIRVMTSE